jgi:hypothetical protein
MKRGRKNDKKAQYIGAGLAIGAGVGVAMGNIAIGIAVGLAIGAALWKLNQKSDDAD